MTLGLTPFTWQVLRAVARAGKVAPVGRDLRLVLSRKTKDGTFLTKLVEDGLIRVAKANADPFQATYALTPLGDHAAEYGEYEFQMPSLKEGGKKGKGGR